MGWTKTACTNSINCLQERELKQRQEEEKREAFRRAIIEEERQKLLKEHASQLLGYLPKVRFCPVSSLF